MDEECTATMDEECAATMDEECIVRGIYTFQEGDVVAIASRAAYYKIFQTSSCGADSQSANNVQGGQGSNKATQHAPPRPLDAAASGVPDAQPMPPSWPTDPIFGLMGKVVKVRPTGHIDVIFESGETRSGNEPKSVKRTHSGAVQTQARKPTTYTVVPDALLKVRKPLPGDIVMFVPDIRADRNLESMPNPYKFETKICLGVVLDANEGVDGKIPVSSDGDFPSRRRLELELIARREDNYIRHILMTPPTWDLKSLNWRLENLQTAMEELPDVDMTPRRVDSPYAPGDDVELSDDLAMFIREHRPEVWIDSVHENHLLNKRVVTFKGIKSLQQHGKVVQVNSSGYCVVLFADGTVWHIQSSFLKLVQGLEGYSEGEGMGSQEALSENVDNLIHGLMSYVELELRIEILRAACFSGKEHLLSYIISAGVTVECEDENGNRPLHIAAHSNQPKIISHLLRLGADINATNNRKHTALQFAAKQGFVGCVRALTEHHNTLNPNIQDDIGNTALHVAIANTNVGIFNELVELPNIDFTVTNKYGLNALHMAAMKGDTTMTEKILSIRDDLVDVKQLKHGYAALHFAAVNGHCQVVKTLLAQESCTVDLLNNQQETALLLAAQQGYWNVVTLLILSGANMQRTDRHGNTALHLSLMGLNEHSRDLQEIPTIPAMQVIEKKIVERGLTFDPRLRMACFLLRHGADISCSNKEGKTPLEIASCLGQPSLQVLELWIAASGKCDECLEAPAEIAFIPSGQCLYCNDCAERMKRRPSCRTLIVERSATGCSSETGPQNKKFKVSKANIPMFAEEVYRMENKPRGMCIIINNVHFHGRKEPRHGSDIDADNMKSLFTNLHFEVTINTNLTVQDMLNVLSHAAKAELQRTADCLIVILMSHGSKNIIEGTDSKCLHLRNDVFALFNNANCPALKGKPKLFFVQACRGGNINYATDNAQRRPAADTAPPESLPEWSDIYCAYATIPDYVAIRDQKEGSWFLSAVYDVFSQHAATTDLEGLMRKVASQIMQRSTPEKWMQTPNTKTYGWRKKLYFNQGN